MGVRVVCPRWAPKSVWVEDLFLCSKLGPEALEGYAILEYRWFAEVRKRQFSARRELFVGPDAPRAP